MRYLLLLSTFYLSLATLTAQVTITGTVQEKGTGTPIEFATVIVGDPETRTDLAGATTDLDGKFEVTTTAEAFFVEVSFIGLEAVTITDFTVEKGRVALGVIELGADAEVLQEVEVRAERSSVEFKLDKRVFNVGEDLSSTGAGALEVLNNVPSVNVDIEGSITLRGSGGVQILINGKPSILASEEGNALGSITADMIERIEVITNPSAKYEAGGTSGIINIVLKKDERRGFNGSVSVNTGVPDNHSVGVSVNHRSEKFNFFSQAGAGYRSLPRDSENINRDLVNGTEIRSFGEDFRNELFFNGTVGADYLIDDYNTLTLSGNFAYEIEDQPSETRFQRIATQTNDLLAEWRREEETEATNPKYQYDLQYQRDFKDNEDHDLLISATGSFFGKDQSSVFNNTNILADFADESQRTRTNFQEALNTFKVDYTCPVGERWTFETGAQYVLNNVSNDFEVSDLINGEFIPNIDFTNVFEYEQNVLGVYGTGSYEADKWGVKAGLRVENTDLNTLLVNTDERNSMNFTNFFPSFSASYKFTEALSVQSSYSRRVRRPRLWNLNPFFNIRNNFSIRTGNPELLPEFTDSYEVSAIYIFKQVVLNASAYRRFTSDVIDRVNTFEDGVSFAKPFNIGTNTTNGLELNGKYDPVRWLTFTGDINYFFFEREGTFDGTDLGFNADQWSAKLLGKVELPADIDFEITGRYRSGVETLQGRVSANIFADFGLRKKFMKGRMVANLSVRDVFASRFRESFTEQPTFFLYNYGIRGRFVTLGFSYGFGKGDAMEYSGRRRR